MAYVMKYIPLDSQTKDESVAIIRINIPEVISQLPRETVIAVVCCS
jgi:hypothetical protein